MYLTCSEGYSGIYPKYQGNGTWLFGYDYIHAQGGTSSSGYMWYWAGDSPANQIFGINVVAGDSDGKYVESHMKFMIKELIALPAKGKITMATASKKKVTVRYSKLSKASRYQIAYKRSGSGYKYVTTTSTSKTIKGLKSKKYYYIKVRGQRYVDGTYYSGSWSTAKKVKVK